MPINTNENETKKAGAVILNKNRDSVLLLYRAKKDWSFPKGHIEQGENETQAMIREVREETGLEVEIIQELPATKYTTDKNENCVLYFYLVVLKDDLNLRIENDNDVLEWVNIDDIVNKISYDNLKILRNKKCTQKDACKICND